MAKLVYDSALVSRDVTSLLEAAIQELKSIISRCNSIKTPYSFSVTSQIANISNNISEIINELNTIVNSLNDSERLLNDSNNKIINDFNSIKTVDISPTTPIIQ